MEEPAETREETKHSRGFGRYALWAGVVLLMYFLSMGPYVALDYKSWQGRPSWLSFFDTLYYPLYWAYGRTPLRKPIGLYLHLWCPQAFDKDGYIQ